MSPLNPRYFLPYQRKWIRDASRFKIMEKSRQIGISYATAYRVVAATSAEGNRYDAWISSRDDLQAQLFGHDCQDFAELMHRAAGDLDCHVIDAGQQITAHTLPLANGRAINSMSSNPNAQAGKRGARILDEFALHPDPRRLYAIAYPGTMWGGGLEIISTHRGTANFFYELLQEIQHKGNPKKFSLHRVTLLDAVNQGLLEKLQLKWPKDDPRQSWSRDTFLQDKRAGCPDEESWQQEFMCQPADDQSAFLSYDLIASCQYPLPDLKCELRQDSAPIHSILDNFLSGLFVGVDIGREHDLTVIWVLEKLEDVHYTRLVQVMGHEPFDAQEQALDAILTLPQIRRCCIDQTGLGCQFVERAGRRFRGKIEGLTFTSAVKEQLAYPVRAAFESKTVRIPDDPVIRADLRAIKKVATAAGHIRFAADRGKNGHADRFWALALALHAAANFSAPGIAVPFAEARFNRVVAARKQRKTIS